MYFTTWSGSVWRLHSSKLLSWQVLQAKPESMSATTIQLSIPMHNNYNNMPTWNVTHLPGPPVLLHVTLKSQILSYMYADLKCHPCDINYLPRPPLFLRVILKRKEKQEDKAIRNVACLYYWFTLMWSHTPPTPTIYQYTKTYLAWVLQWQSKVTVELITCILTWVPPG